MPTIAGSSNGRTDGFGPSNRGSIPCPATMILATHAIVGAGAAQIFSTNPVTAFAIGFVGHFLLDAIPHWHYPLASANRDVEGRIQSMPMGRKFIADLIRIGLDCLIGFILVIILFLSLQGGETTGVIPLTILLTGAFGGILPDALQFAYLKIRKEPLISLQKFHLFIHSKKDLDNRPFLGITSQALVIIIVIALVAVT